MSNDTRALEVARTWLGTPYHHQASVRGAGCDCLGLIRGVWREVYGSEPEAPPAYSPDWSEVTGEETLLRAARRNLVEIPVEDAGAGEVVIFRMTPKGPAKHAGILSVNGRFIHAYSGRAVVENALGPWWQAKIVAAFGWPEIEA